MKPTQSTPRRDTINVAFRLERTSHAVLLERAETAGVSTRVWLEDAILKNQTRIFARQKPHKDLTALLFQLSRAGNNLNQITHLANALHARGKLDKTEFVDALEQLDCVTDLLRRMLDHAR